MQKRWLFLAALVAGGFIGCGGGAADAVVRVVVSGKVIKGGQPVAKGRITLYPVEGTKAPTSGAEIMNGEYRIDAKGGVPVGTHRIEVHEYEVKQNIPGRPSALDIENNILPDQYNTKSKLEIKVDDGEPIVKDIDLDKDF
ncbi:MAG: hypothetical protein O3A29_22260 [Planctomycetota bacterium]|nr:hypothetical protein [Planctomycetota bacterium]